MKRLLFLLLVACSASADWRVVRDGIEVQRITRGTMDAHVVRIDLRRADLRVVASDREDRSLTVSEFARRRQAIVAINGDYFTETMDTIGLAMDACGVWATAKPVRREPVVAVGKRRAAIDFFTKPKRWMTGAVAGWPMLVEGCAVKTTLPGSDFFTRAPHPRTAVGLSKDRRTLLFVVADGRREGVPGLTLPELAQFLFELGACTAINLDGGGSSAMWVEDAIVNRPSDPVERKVANHLAVILAEDYSGCDSRRRSSKE